MVCTTVPRVLASATPHRSGHTAHGAWMADELIGIHGAGSSAWTTENETCMPGRRVLLNLAEKTTYMKLEIKGGGRHEST